MERIRSGSSDSTVTAKRLSSFSCLGNLSSESILSKTLIVCQILFNGVDNNDDDGGGGPFRVVLFKGGRR